MVTSAPTPPHSANVFQRDRGGATKFIYPDTPMTLPLQSSAAGAASAAAAATPSGANSAHNLNAAPAVPRDKVTSPNPIIDSVKSYDSDKTLSGRTNNEHKTYNIGQSLNAESFSSVLVVPACPTWHSKFSPKYLGKALHLYAPKSFILEGPFPSSCLNDAA